MRLIRSACVLSSCCRHTLRKGQQAISAATAQKAAADALKVLDLQIPSGALICMSVYPVTEVLFIVRLIRLVQLGNISYVCVNVLINVAGKARLGASIPASGSEQ